MVFNAEFVVLSQDLAPGREVWGRRGGELQDAVN